MKLKNKAVNASKSPDTAKTPSSVPNTWHQTWLHFDVIAAEMPAEKVKICRADLRVVRANVRFALANLGIARELIVAELPKVAVDQLFELGELANALVYNGTRVVKPVSDGEIAMRIERVSPLRTRVLIVAEVLAQMGYFKVGVVAQIRSGNGLYDMAEDCVALAGLFEERWSAIKGTHPFTHEDMETLRVDGEWLLNNITPTGARRQTVRSDGGARDSRDRMWTVLVERYDVLRRVAYYFHGDQFESFVPKLQSSIPRAAEETDEPIDAPVDAPTKGTPVATPAKTEPTKPLAQPAVLTP